MLAPIWDEAADKISKELGSGKVVVGKVDCDKHGKYFLNQLPHIKKLNLLKTCQILNVLFIT